MSTSEAQVAQEPQERKLDLYQKNNIPRETYLKEAAKLYPMASPVAVTSVMAIEDFLIAGGEIVTKVTLLHLALMFMKQVEKMYQFHGFSTSMLERLSTESIMTSVSNMLGAVNDAGIRAAKELDGTLAQFNPDAQDLPNQFGITELQYQVGTFYIMRAVMDTLDRDWDLTEFLTLMEKPAIRRVLCMNLYDMLREENEKMNKFVQETSLGQLYPFVLNEQIRQRQEQKVGSPILTPNGMPANG